MKSALTVFLAGILMASCAMNRKITDSDTMTLLVYIAGNSKLGAQEANDNIESLKLSLAKSMSDCNLLVYADIRNSNDSPPALLLIHDLQIDTIKVYPKQSSVDPVVLNNVIEDVLNGWNSQYYGLVLWSHGMGWLPTGQLHSVAQNLNYSQTRSFGLEASESAPGYKCMEIDGLVEAIPDGVFDYIVFDACYMGNIEVAYALRKKANYIISSCFEIISSGFPYERITRDLLSGNLKKVCSQFYEKYMESPKVDQIAGVSLVRTGGLDNLASAFRKIVSDKQEIIGNMDISDIQCFDRFNRHVFFDIEDFVDHLTGRDSELADFKNALSDCIEYSISTDYAYLDATDTLKVEKYCGLSVYIPLKEYDAIGLNGEYRKTEWSKATNY